IGDHTDYQDGWCLPMAIDRATTVVFDWDASSAQLRVSSDAFAECVDLPVAIDAIRPGEFSWAATIAGVIATLREHGAHVAGGHLAITRDVPLGPGLSSSAALGVAATLALATAAGPPPKGVALAKVAQRAEHIAGVPCGLLDQMAAVFGERDHALLLDCRAL